MNSKQGHISPNSLSEGITTDGGWMRMIDQKEYTIITCPVCGKRIADRLISYNVEIRKISDCTSTRWKPDIIDKCERCKSEIGIKKQ